MGISSFRNFAEKRLQASAFKTNPDSDQTHIFHSSLESTHHQFKWTNDATNSTGEKFKLSAGFLDTFSPNALADRYQNTYFIGIYVALFVAISEFAMFCFAQREFFADVGDPSKETSPNPWDNRLPGLWLMDNTAKGGRVENKHSRHLIPKDSERYIMSQYLSLLMVRFVWLHELAHCFNGHVDLVQNRDIALRLYEVAPQLDLVQSSKQRFVKPCEDMPNILKCLEFDADNSALWANCNIQLRDLENLEGIRELDNDLSLRLTIFGSYAMIWLFDAFQTYLNSQNGLSHPEPSLRLQNLLRTAQTRLFSIGDGIEDLHAQSLAEFDPIKQAIPNMFKSGTLRDMAFSEAEAVQLSGFDVEFEAIKKALAVHQFHTASG